MEDFHTEPPNFEASFLALPLADEIIERLAIAVCDLMELSHEVDSVFALLNAEK